MMTIDKLPGIGQQLYGASKRIGQLNKLPQSPQGDSIKISVSAQAKLDTERMALAKTRLGQHLNNGVIAPAVLERVTDKIAAELGYQHGVQS